MPVSVANGTVGGVSGVGVAKGGRSAVLLECGSAVCGDPALLEGHC